MPHTFYPSGTPRFNHVALSLPADHLDQAHRDDLCKFWGEVFGFEELDVMTEDRARLVFACVHWDQFIFIVSEDEPMRCPPMDHFGFAVGSMDELLGVQRRAKEYRQHDNRVEVIDVKADDQDVVIIHSLYVRYLLPMMCEVQWWEFPS